VAIIGKVGSGKSSLLSSMFGEMYAYKPTEFENFGSMSSISSRLPHVYVNGTVSYVSQTTWIRSQTFKENILFGDKLQNYDEKRYKDAIKYACLESDLEQLQDGEETAIGDKGVNLSGGQKVR